MGALVRPKVSPTEATGPSVRQAGCFAIRTRRSASNQYVDTGDWGLLPFVAAHVSAPETNWQSAQQVWESELIAYRGRHEARSMAKTAVSGSLIGSMPTRLIMEDDCAVRLSLDPRRTMLQTQIGKAWQQYAPRRAAPRIPAGWAWFPTVGAA